MKASEYQKVKEMSDRLIAFINWKGADFNSKRRKVIKEISLIKEFCKNCTYGEQRKSED